MRSKLSHPAVQATVLVTSFCVTDVTALVIFMIKDYKLALMALVITSWLASRLLLKHLSLFEEAAKKEGPT